MAVAGGLVFGACNITTAVNTTVHQDGSGRVQVVVTLDADAAKRAASQYPEMATDLRTNDLVKAGWKVTGPTAQPDGSAVITATKPFSTLVGARTAFGELSGANGPFSGFRITQHRRFPYTTTRFEGTVDLSGGLNGFGDDKLRATLGGPGIGVDPTLLRDRAGTLVDRLLSFKVAVILPKGQLASNSALPLGDSGAAWQPKLGEKAHLIASSRKYDRARLGYAIAAVVTGVAALALFLWAIGKTLRSRRRA
ncbi:MAG: hypothetical protein QOG03_401 [Actinomycetota bacterium]|nr:hypothetical protein [Actinomycetota bacterium]